MPGTRPSACWMKSWRRRSAAAAGGLAAGIWRLVSPAYTYTVSQRLLSRAPPPRPAAARSSPPQLSAELAAAASALTQCLWGSFGLATRLAAPGAGGGLSREVVRLFTQLLPPYFATAQAVAEKPQAVRDFIMGLFLQLGTLPPPPWADPPAVFKALGQLAAAADAAIGSESAGGMALRGGGGRQKELAEVRFALLIDSLVGGAVESLAQRSNTAPLLAAP